MKRKISTAALAVSCTTLMFAVPASAEPEVGTVAQREFLGALGTRESGEQHDLYFNESVYSNEAVETGATSATNLRFLDNTNLYVGASSRVVLDRFVYDPEQRLGDVAISFGKGAFRFITGNIENKENVSLSTPTATMTIRGTELLIFVLSDGTSEINVLEGAVDLLPCETDEPVRVNAGEALFITTSCETTALEARVLPFGARYPELPPELAALEGSTLPAAGGDEPDDGDDDDSRGKEDEESAPPAPEPPSPPSEPETPTGDDDSPPTGDSPGID
jgi:hypothetical protein